MAPKLAHPLKELWELQLHKANGHPIKKKNHGTLIAILTYIESHES